MARNENKRRCGARTRVGRQCRGWALPGSEPPRCYIHERGAPPDDERRCVATTKAGGRCGAWAVEGEDLCSRHVGRFDVTEEDRRAGRICTALTKAGKPCPNWALEDSEALLGRVLCHMHAGMNNAAKAAEVRGKSMAGRRCEAVTGTGEQCGKWAALDTREQGDGEGKALCHMHAGRFRLPEAGERRCEAQTRAGARCPNWAVVGIEAAYGRLLCPAHLPEGDERRAYPGWLCEGLHRGAQRCAATTWDGTRCRNRAMWGEDGGSGDLCWIHAFPEKHPAIRHGYYWRTPHFSDAEQAAIAREAREGEPMTAELLIIRLKLRDVLKYTKEDELPAERLDSAARVIYRGANAVATLLKARRRLMEIQWKPGSAGGSRVLLEGILEEDGGRVECGV